MKIRVFASYLCLLLISSVVHAADLNGYTSEYECRNGGPRCNIAVETLAGPSAACGQVVTTFTPWSSINWTNSVICIEAGDHRSKGVLFLGGSGTSGNYKVLRYYRSGDTNDDPWDQGANQAILSGINTNAQDFWIINRLVATNNYGSNIIVNVQDGSGAIILNRMYIKEANGDLVQIGVNGVSDITLQNSYLHSTRLFDFTSVENMCVDVRNTTRTRIVNNEIRDCIKTVTVASGANPQFDMIVENNDLYISDAAIVSCSGPAGSGICAWIDANISLKYGGVSSGPMQFIHNRLWLRKNLGNAEFDFEQVPIISQSAEGPATFDGADWTIWKNNIIAEGPAGFWNYWWQPNNVSVVGNIFYSFGNIERTTAIEGKAFEINEVVSLEIYFNTIVDASQNWLRIDTDSTNGDIKCNAILNSGSPDAALGAGTQANHNIYYSASNLGELNRLDFSLVTRQTSQFYSAGTIMRTGPSSSCSVAFGDTDCFLYRAIVGGTSGAGTPSFCTVLGCTFSDGGVTWQAIRGPYLYYRKLLSSPELAVVPYAEVHSSAPEVGFCPSVGTSGAIGSRTGIGINNDIAPNGIFQTDIAGRNR